MLWDAISGQADDIKSLVVTRLTYHTNFTARAIIIGKIEKNKGFDDEKTKGKAEKTMK
jgi:hypothetical protein